MVSSQEEKIFSPKEDNIDTEIFSAPKVEKRKMTVTGYDASLPKGGSQTGWSLQVCGFFLQLVTSTDLKRALVYIRGEGAAEKAVKLNGGCECDEEECKIGVDKVMPSDRNPNRVLLNCGGLNLPACFTPPNANMTTE
ncbi:unnamed protein product [Arabis nemorensis]|uniref:Uncharacterized protein n=1 Tax=Arabis nemorensis TaxID=586526 RepID=A0A565CK16_9BRAS|nr:unnamed protein product [Arabis nemorensis]